MHSLGQKGPEQSGLAIERRQQQGDLSTINYADNLARAMRLSGRIIMDIVPKIYDTPRLQRIVMPDDTNKMVVIHSGADQADAAQKLATENAITRNPRYWQRKIRRHDHGGSIFPIQAPGGCSTPAGFCPCAPETLPIVGDLIVRNMDWPQADEFADRMKKMLPPAAAG